LHLQRQITKLKEMILAVGTLVEESVDGAIRAVESGDEPLARKIIDQDNHVDRMEMEVEEECLHTLALHQPVAFDLRFIVAILKINNDLERIADYSVNIAEKVELMNRNRAAAKRYLEGELPGVPWDLPTMARKARAMLRQSLDAMVNLDPVLAEKVRLADDEVDLIHRQNYGHVNEAVRSDPDGVDLYLNVLGISRNLERIADHAVNIAEDVLYMIRGDILRHSRVHTIDKNAK
jgi:phosphate transport system protein